MTSNGQDSAKPLRTGDPRELGDYRILGRLGRGGMGTVYLAQTAGGRRVAVKLIHPDLADDEAFRRRFAREVESAQRVARFSTAGVIDARLDGEPLFIVSEYVPGPNLAEAIAADGPMAGGTLDGLAMGVAAALTAIHGAGVIHRDLKPANVLLSTVGPKVIDFGIARAMEDDGAVTRSSQLMGTPSYLAPEIIAGREIAPPSDIFSWGCLVAFAGTGRAPFDAPSVPAVLHQISSMPADLEGLDDSLRTLVEPALSKEPAERPTAQQILNRLVGQEDPSDSVVDSTVVRSWTPPSTARPDAGGALAAGAAGAAAGGAAGAALAGPPTPP
ncbi:serine/threonine-protein kinase, partial [Nocardiopsis coralliicola]